MKDGGLVEHISIRRRLSGRDVDDRSSLQVEADHLRVIGILPHLAEIRLEPEARAQLRAWLDKQEPALNRSTFTIFCREATGKGTTYVDSAEGATWQEAARTVLDRCATDWDMDSDEINVIGVTEGEVNIIAWDDEPDGSGVPL
jgi:hypothetical protein